MKLFQKKNNINVLPESERVREIYGYMGKTGSGKSYAMKQYLSTLKTDRIIIIDTMGEYNTVDLDHHGLKRFVIIEDVKQFVEHVFDHLDKPIRIVYQPLDINEEIEIIAETIFTLSKCAVGFEEIDMVLPQKGKCSPAMLKLVQRGRHRAISIYWTTQTPSEVSKLLIKNTNKIFIFRITERNDLAYLSFVDSELRKTIPTLEKFAHIEIS